MADAAEKYLELSSNLQQQLRDLGQRKYIHSVSNLAFKRLLFR